MEGGRVSSDNGGKPGHGVRTESAQDPFFRRDLSTTHSEGVAQRESRTPRKLLFRFPCESSFPKGLRTPQNFPFLSIGLQDCFLERSRVFRLKIGLFGGNSRNSPLKNPTFGVGPLRKARHPWHFGVTFPLQTGPQPRVATAEKKREAKNDGSSELKEDE